MPFEGLIEVKEVIIRVTVPGNVMLGQLHGVHINYSHEFGVFFQCMPSKDQNARGGQLVETGPQGKLKGLYFIIFNL